MNSFYMLDTNTVSYIARGQSPAARARLLQLQEDQIGCISAITEAEIRYGLARRPEATALKILMEGFIASIRVLPWGGDEAKAYGLLRAKLESSGLTLGNLDLMIAAHAASIGSVLVTSDKAFHQVDELQSIVNWATDL